MKRLLLMNLIPIVAVDVATCLLTVFGCDSDIVLGIAIYAVAAQYFIVMPLYYVITLAVCHFKYGLKILKGFALQIIILLSTIPIYIVISMIFYFFQNGELLWSFADLLKIMSDIRGWFEFCGMYILPALSIMLPGMLIIALISHIRKRKA